MASQLQLQHSLRSSPSLHERAYEEWRSEELSQKIVELEAAKQQMQAR